MTKEKIVEEIKKKCFELSITAMRRIDALIDFIQEQTANEELAEELQEGKEFYKEQIEEVANAIIKGDLIALVSKYELNKGERK